MGYARAGFDVVGVDIRPMPRYPFEFVQADCLALDRAFLDRFDAIHASPPCQAHSTLRHMPTAKDHPDLIPQTRALLTASGKPWIIENVPGAPLRNPVMLCGTMFGLVTECGAELRRHRLFETNWWVGLLPQCRHGASVIGVYGNGPHKARTRTITVTGSTPQQNVVRNQVRQTFSQDAARQAMGIDWMKRDELNQAIPPSYTEFLGRQLLAFMAGQAAA